MPEPQPEATAVIFRTHLHIVLVMSAAACGRFEMYRVPMVFDMQVFVDTWFDARRPPVAGQMEADNA